MGGYINSQDFILHPLFSWSETSVNDHELKRFSVNSCQHLTVNYQKMVPWPPLSLVILSFPETKHRHRNIFYMFLIFIFRAEAVS